MKVGHLIRTERVRQKMKQVVLARGICTPSYLSKIERNQISPSEQIVTLLFNKLGIDVNTLQENDQKTDIEYENMLMSSYKEVITKRDESFTKQRLAELDKQNSLFENDSLHYTYLLIKLRFRLALGSDLDERKKDIDDLEKLKENFDVSHYYLFKLNKALYYYAVKKQKQAIEQLEDILAILETIELDEWEKAEFYYLTGVIYTADNRIFQSIDYIRKALTYFRENFLMQGVIECYVVIGVTQKRSEQFQDALEYYSKAKQLCDEFNLDNQKGMVYHNLGTMYGIMGDNSKSIHYLQKGIEHKKNKKSHLISILCIVMEYSKMKNKKEVINWCDKGISLLSQLNDESLASYTHHFNLYKSLHSETGLSESIAKEAIEHFKLLQDHQHVHKYCIALAESYYDNRKYKLSSSYYKESIRYGYIYRKLEKWEDL